MYIWQLDWIIQVIDGREKNIDLTKLESTIEEEINQFKVESYGDFDYSCYT